VVSVDTKKKELIGNFAHAGQAWCREAEVINVYDFRQDAVGGERGRFRTLRSRWCWSTAVAVTAADSLNGASRPLRTFERMVGLIRGTTTST
jgi:hypothetical protein